MSKIIAILASMADGPYRVTENPYQGGFKSIETMDVNFKPELVKFGWEAGFALTYWNERVKFVNTEFVVEVESD